MKFIVNFFCPFCHECKPAVIYSNLKRAMEDVLSEDVEIVYPIFPNSDLIAMKKMGLNIAEKAPILWKDNAVYNYCRGFNHFSTFIRNLW